METVSINKGIKLSPHFTLGEMTKTSYETRDGNIPSRVAIENLINLCEGWLEDLRYSYNQLYGKRPPLTPPVGGGRNDSAGGNPVGGGRNDSAGDNPPPTGGVRGGLDIPLIINSAYRSEEVNRCCGGSPTSNHLTGCAADIRCLGPEQMIRYAAILLDMADGTGRDFDELLLERRGTTYWIHFAVRPEGNRRKIAFDIR